MRKELATVLLGLALAGCSEPSEQVANAQTATSVEPDSEIETYQLLASELLKDIRIQSDAELVRSHADNLIKQGSKVLDAFNLAYPQCQPYFNAVQTIGGSLSGLSLDELEQGYHDGNKLPELPDPVCYHGKELMLHPARVLVIVKDGLGDDESYLEAELEMVEAMAHAEQVKQAIKRSEAAAEEQAIANDSTSN
ncbi:hypothetical protein CWB99_01950 [Pseudoalteromonas rubra]|uniref:Lipoprotein n=1 Tax=Pseudoalteromonas rubra TaxID=43658 RepID=A0A5S3WUY8_9GAMM|nr:hypothetical protein [Pseudoalteromonas rubra]TMP32363.1 hypothetical protein CWB99_01950 [Pseudoalteromonas rubra]TMP36359.1 hypothetical protein CWC00_01770 [Pseudoalteromonas rubra]